MTGKAQTSLFSFHQQTGKHEFHAFIDSCLSPHVQPSTDQPNRPRRHDSFFNHQSSSPNGVPILSSFHQFLPTASATMPPHPAATYTIANPNLAPTVSPIKLETCRPCTCNPLKYVIATILALFLFSVIQLCVRGMVRTWKGAMRYIDLCEKRIEEKRKNAVKEKESVSKND